MKKIYLFGLIVPAIISVFALLPQQQKSRSPHSPEELAFLKKHQAYFYPESAAGSGDPNDLLPIDSNI